MLAMEDDDIRRRQPVPARRQQGAIVDTWLPHAPVRPSTLKLKHAGGHPPGYDKYIVRKEARRLMEHYGPFNRGDATWNTRTRLLEKLDEFCVAMGWGHARRESLRTDTRDIEFTGQSEN
jgi:hypothetical protein